MEDAQLLAEYAQTGSEAAFRTLVERHINLVHGSALRQLGEPHSAEEVTQAVFILLARKAGSLGHKTVLAGWLFRTTRFVAARVRRTEYRRLRREQEAFEMHKIATSQDAWERIAPVLDEALEKLGTSERDAVLLRFMEGRNHREVGAVLGLTEEAARKRVDRALEKLRGFFANGGLTLSAAALGSALLANTSKAAPVGLVNTITTAAVAGGSAAAATLPAIVTQTLNAWHWAKVKLAGGVIGSGILLVTTIATIYAASHNKPALSSPGNAMAVRNPLSGQAALSSPVAKSPSPRSSASDSTGQALLFKVVAADSGEPIARAPLVAMFVTREKWEPNYNLVTDDSGTCRVPLPPQLGRLFLGVLADGWGARYADWMPARDDPVPPEYTIRLERTTNSIGGVLQDESGNAVVGAEIWAQFDGIGDSTGRERLRERAGVFPEGRVAVTGRDGRWHSSAIPPNAGFSLEARHPDFAPTQMFERPWMANPNLPKPVVESDEIKELRAGTLITKMQRGLSLYGRVTDSSNQPIAGAVISHNPMAIGGGTALKTDLDGRFAFHGLSAGQFAFATTAEGFAPERRIVDMKDGLDVLNITMLPGGKLRVRVVDKDGSPVSAATVELEQWGTNLYDLVWRPETDAEGRVEWNSAPVGQNLELCIMKNGWCYKRGIYAMAGGEEHTFILERGLEVSGEVTDAVTGAPIPEFKAIPGFARDSWERSEIRPGVNGRFRMVFEERGNWRIRIEAEGYAPAISGVLSETSTNTLHFSLQPTGTVGSMHGKVLQPDGSPAPGIQVAILTLDKGVALVDTRFASTYEDSLTTTDASGGFSFKTDPRAHSVAAVSSNGFANFRVRDASQPISLGLQPWGRVEATLSDDFQLETVNSVGLSDKRTAYYRGAVEVRKSARPSGTNLFIFEDVPAGVFHLTVYRGYTNMPKTSFPSITEITVQPGQTTKIRLEPKGRTVIGHVMDSSGSTNLAAGGATAWLRSRNRAQPQPAQRGAGNDSPVSGDAAAFWAVDYWQSPAALEQLRTRDFYTFVLSPDGTLYAEGVEPGAYRLMVSQAGRTLTNEVQIPTATPGGPEKVDLGTIELPNSAR